MGRPHARAAGRRWHAAGDGFPHHAIFTTRGKRIDRAIRIHSRGVEADYLCHSQLLAWRLAAPDRKHVVPVASGIRTGRRVGTAYLCAGLLHLRGSRSAIPFLDESRQHGRNTGSLGSCCGINGRLPGAVSYAEDQDGVAAELSNSALQRCGVLAAPLVAWI